MRNFDLAGKIFEMILFLQFTLRKRHEKISAFLLTIAPLLSANFAQANPIKAYHSEKCVEILNASTAQGAPAVQANCIAGRISQDWYSASAGNGLFYIVSSQSGKCLAVLNGSVNHGAAIVLAECASNPWYKWQIQTNPDGFTKRFVAGNSGLCMAVINGSQTHGASIVQANCTNEPFFRFYF